MISLGSDRNDSEKMGALSLAEKWTRILEDPANVKQYLLCVLNLKTKKNAHFKIKG